MIASMSSNLAGAAFDPGRRQDIVYVGDDNNLYLLDFDRTERPSAPWGQLNLIELVQRQSRVTLPYPVGGTGAPRSASPLSVFAADVWHSNLAVYIGDADGANHVAAVLLEQDTPFDLTDASGTAKNTPRDGSPLTAWNWENQKSLHTAYIDQNGHVIELYWTEGSPATHWQSNDLSYHTGYSGGGGGDLPRNNSPLAAATFEHQNTQHVFYIARDNTIRELYYSAGAWHGNNLSQATGAPTPARDTDLAAYVCEYENTQHVIYLADNGDVQELYWSAGWVAGTPDLTQTTGAAQPVSGCALIGYSAEYETTQHIVYPGVDGDLHELYHTQDGWATTNLTQSAGVNNPRTGTPLAGYAFENERTHHVVYVDTANVVREVYREGQQWLSGVHSDNLPVQQ
jgi:hypothetical protein